MSKLMTFTDGKVSSLELLKEINMFRSSIEGKSELKHYDLLKVVRDEFEDEIDNGEISSISYKDSMNREKPMFNLTISQAKQVLVRESKVVRKAVIKRLEELESVQAKALPATYLDALKALVESEEAKQVVIKERDEAVKEVEYKEDVIIGLVKDITVAEKRQRLNQIIRHNFKDGASAQEKWRLLYSEFEAKFHISVKRRMASCTMKPKAKSKLDYIDRKLNIIPEIYELACKIFESNIQDLKSEWFEIVRK